MQGESKITQYTNDAIRNFWINREESGYEGENK